MTTKQMLFPIDRPAAAVFEAIMDGRVHVLPHVTHIERKPQGRLAQAVAGVTATIEVLHIKVLFRRYTVTWQVAELHEARRSCLMAITEAPFGIRGTVHWAVRRTGGSRSRTSVLAVTADIPSMDLIPGFLRTLVAKPDPAAVAACFEQAIPI